MTLLQFVIKTVKSFNAWSVHDREWYLRSARRIAARAEDPYLNVAMIGDFSSGKSTFINALIGRELLKTAWLATTAVPTRIYEHEGSGVEIAVETTNGERYELKDRRKREALEARLGKKLPEEEKDLIAYLTTSNALVDQIREVTVRTPGNGRFADICIIDTPGVNPGAKGTEHHVRVTQNVLREHADAAIVLFKGNQVYTNSFSKFLEENASHFLDDAVFVVTMLDIVDEDERDELLQYVRTQLAGRFGLKDAQVYGCSAKYVNLPDPDDDKKVWNERFDALRDEMARHIGARRQSIIQRQLETLLDELLTELDKEIAHNTEFLRGELAVLERNSTERLKEELQANYEKYSQAVEREYRTIPVNERYLVMFRNIQERSAAGIYSCTKLAGKGCETIGGYMKEGFPVVVKQEQDRLSGQIARDFAPVNRYRQKYCEENKALFLRYELALRRDVGAPAGNAEELRYSQEFSVTGVTGTDGFQDILEAVGALAMLPVLVPLIFVDEFLGTGMADFVENALNGIVNFIGGLGVLDRNKRKAVEELNQKLYQARKENEGKFLEQMTAAKENVLSSMKEINDIFLKEYEKTYRVRSQESAKEQARIEEELKRNRDIQKRIRKYRRENKNK